MIWSFGGLAGTTKAPWVRRALPAYHAEVSSVELRRQYNEVLPRLTAAYHAASPELQDRIEAMDRDFNEGRPAALIAWARVAVPGAFPAAPVTRRLGPAASMPVTTPVEPLHHLPARIYHGSRALHRVLVEGFHLPPAKMIGNDTYTWARVRQDRDGYPIAWGPYAWEWFRGLTPEGRKSLQQQTGAPIRSMRDLGAAVSLLWGSTYEGDARGYAQAGEPVLEIDPRRLAIYGWFEPDVVGKGEVVLVLSATAPQGKPNAVVGVVEK